MEARDFKMASEDKREVSTVSGSRQVDVLICLHDSTAGETVRKGSYKRPAEAQEVLEEGRT